VVPDRALVGKEARLEAAVARPERYLRRPGLADERTAQARSTGVGQLFTSALAARLASAFALRVAAAALAMAA
jgi:hypothetical protein